MGAVWMCTRALLRRRVAGTVAVAVLIGVAGGAVLAAAAGARRTETAYPRLLERVNAADVEVNQNFSLESDSQLVDPSEFADLPHVQEVAKLSGFGVAGRSPDGLPNLDLGAAGGGSDGALFYDIERPILDRGRMPRKDRPNEVAINEVTARTYRLDIGDTYHVFLFRFVDFSALQEQLQRDGREPADLTEAELDAVFEPVALEVTGIGRGSEDIVVGDRDASEANILLSPAFTRKHSDRATYFAAWVQLDDPSNLEEFQNALRRRYPQAAFAFLPKTQRLDVFATAVTPYTQTLWLFALIAALTSLLVVGQAIARMSRLDNEDAPTLRALGIGPRRALAAIASRGLVASVVGAMLAVVFAIAFSPLFPIGPARRAALSRGLDVDALVLAVGLLVIVALFSTCAAVAAWRAQRRLLEPAPLCRRSKAVETLGRLGIGPAVTSGIRYSVQRDRRSGAPSPAATLTAVATAIATIVAALLFATSLDDLVSTPTSFGWSWDAVYDTYDSGASTDLIESIRNDRDYRDATVMTRGLVLVQGEPVPAFGLRKLRGDVAPTILEGRLPSAPNEIALGAKTLGDLDRSVGDTVSARGPQSGPRRLHVVGRTVLPQLQLAGSAAVGRGAVLTSSGMKRFDPGAVPSFFLINAAKGVRIDDTARANDEDDAGSFVDAQRPGDIRAYADVRSTPFVLAGLLALLGVGVLAHALLTSVQRRRSELAVLKTLGFSRRQVASTVAWQATAIAVLSLLVGVVAGVIAGRLVWQRFVVDLGSGGDAAVPLLAIVLLLLATISFANVIAAMPARIAARTKPAVVLRAE